MKCEAQPMQQHSLKKLRSSLPRRRRNYISPIRLATSPAPSIASSHLARQLSCESSRTSVNNKPPVASPRKRRFEDTSGLAQSKQRQKVSKREEEKNGEERDSSSVQSCFGLDAREINSKEFEVIEERSVTTAKSELSCEFPRKIQTAGDENSVKNDVELSEDSRNVTVLKSYSVKNELACSESELVCYEDDDVSDYTSSFTDLQSEVFNESWMVDFSDEYAPSILFESGSEFSEKSIADDEIPSPTFSLFLQYSQHFCRSTSDSLHSCSDGKNSEEFACLRFEDEENEESYRMLRNRERRQVYFHDYAEEYGELVIQQRPRMVHWMVEQCTKKEFQKETMFLGVNLLDRFLSKGCFKTERNLQIVGIACLALATRIEENQPLNRLHELQRGVQYLIYSVLSNLSVRQKTFRVDCNTYSRCEVVAMEWLVQEVLNFQCFLPTIYNFLWFYLKAAKANKEVEKTAKYLAVVALLGHEQLGYWPSTVAAGLVVLASLAYNQDASCDHVMETHLRTKEDDLPGCMKSLEWLIKYAC